MLQALARRNVERGKSLGTQLAVGIETVAGLEFCQRRGQRIVEAIGRSAELRQLAARHQTLCQYGDPRIAHAFFKLGAARNGGPIARRRVALVERQAMAQAPVKEVRRQMLRDKVARVTLAGSRKQSRRLQIAAILDRRQYRAAQQQFENGNLVRRFRAGLLGDRGKRRVQHVHAGRLRRLQPVDQGSTARAETAVIGPDRLIVGAGIAVGQHPAG